MRKSGRRATSGCGRMRARECPARRTAATAAGVGRKTASVRLFELLSEGVVAVAATVLADVGELLADFGLVAGLDGVDQLLAERNKLLLGRDKFVVLAPDRRL